MIENTTARAIHPSFTLHTSNKTENLLQHLQRVLQQPLPSPFNKEVFLVQSQGMERWLLQSLSSGTSMGVVANYEMLFPKAFFTELAKGLGIDTSATKIFERSALVWEIDSVLADINIPEVKKYCSSGIGAGVDRTKRFLLAQQLSNLFDDYQTFRAEMLNNSGERDQSSWVLSVWDEVIKKLSNSENAHRHSGEIWEELIGKINSLSMHSPPSGWPQRVSVFGIHAMPPIFLKVLNALSKKTQVHLYVTQPTRGYWGDIRSRAEAKQNQIYRLNCVHQHATDSVISSEGSDLLSLLGQQGREFHSLMVEHCEFDWEFDSTDELKPSTSLERLQQSLITQEALERLPLDHSIQVISCHSRLREVEVLKDQLLAMFDEDEDLQPTDVLVMAPNISDYAPFIESIFASQDALPISIADRPEAETNPYYKTFIAVLRASMGRFERSEILELMELQPIKSLLKFTDDDVEAVRAWIDQSCIRWGHSAAHKAQYDVPELSINTWDSGLKQMMRGFMMQDQTLSIEGAQAELMARLDGFVRNVLVDFADNASSERTPSEWASALLDLKDTLFKLDQKECRALSHTLATMKEIRFQTSYQLGTILEWLENQYQESKGPQGFLNGLITCCSMLPMRNIPFKVIAVLGLNDGDFPKMDRRPSFDIMADAPRKGDRSVRADGRYQFLEILLSTRERLYLSFRGQSDAKLQEIPPSGVVAELLNELVEKPEKAIIKHPLQPFSERYFASASSETAAPLFTYNASANQIAETICQQRAEKLGEAWLKVDAFEQIEVAPNSIEFKDFIRFAREPQKWFIQRQLSLNISTVDDEINDHEPFSVDGLDSYFLKQRILQNIIAGEDSKVLIERMRAQGALPVDTFARVDFDVMEGSIDRLAKVYANLPLGARVGTEKIAVSGIEGDVADVYENGAVIVRYASLKAKDYVGAWLTHLVVARPVWLLGIEKDKPSGIRFDVPSQQERATYLNAWLDEYRYAQTTAPRLWVDLGWAAASADDDEAKRREAASKALDSSLGKDFNGRLDRYISRAAEGREFEDIWTAEVKALTELLLAPVIEHKEALKL